MIAATPIIHLAQVSKSFSKKRAAPAYVAVDRLDLEVAPGQLLALLGKTGCGKSTIFNMIAGLTEPTSGAVRVDGRDPFADFDSFRGRIAIVFQNDRLLPWRSAIQNVELGLEMLEIPQAERRATAEFQASRAQARRSGWRCATAAGDRSGTRSPSCRETNRNPRRDLARRHAPCRWWARSTLRSC